MRKTRTIEWGFTQLKELKKSFIWERDEKHPTIIVDMYLKHNDKGQIVFSCIGEIRCEAWGQCEDSINEYLAWDDKWDRIYKLWKEHHLNDLHAWTPKQENLLRMGRLAWVDLSNYDKECKFLKEYNCYFDDNIIDWTSHPYKYGSEWLYRPIPETDLWEILSLLLEN